MEKKKSKKDWSVLIGFLVGLVILILGIGFFSYLTSSIKNCNGYYSVKESKYFSYIYANGEKDSWLCLVGLTEEGKKQRYIYIPSNIDGHNIGSLGRLRFPNRYFKWDESVCEKLFMQEDIVTSFSDFEAAENLKKVFVIDIGIPNENTLTYSHNYYVSKINYDAVKESEYKIKEKLLPANISYNYNYEDSKNYGVYFIDDCDYGSKIEYIPANPTREGYTFDGWYKEPECINKWNFESDTLPEEVKEVNENNEEEVKFQETKLYAKWNKQ